MQVTMVVGLPGSGKSILLQQLRSNAEASGQTVALLDDPRESPELEAFIERVIHEQPDLILIADPALCNAATRQKASDLLRTRIPAAEFHWKFFANDVRQCLLNAEHRADGRNVRRDIYHWSKLYDIPESNEALPVWRPETPMTD